MPDRGKNLPTAGTKADEDLKPGFTYEELQREIWADLDAIYAVEERLPGDLDYHDFMEHYGLSQNGARARMDGLVASGAWQYVTVREPRNDAGKIKVIRRVK